MAILKRFNEKDGARKSKDNNGHDAEQATATEQRQDNNAGAAQAPATTTIDGNDNEPKVYKNRLSP